MTDEPIECVGGPYDGERRVGRGWFWRVMVDGWSGTYVRYDMEYRWEPD